MDNQNTKNTTPLNQTINQASPSGTAPKIDSNIPAKNSQASPLPNQMPSSTSDANADLNIPLENPQEGQVQSPVTQSSESMVNNLPKKKGRRNLIIIGIVITLVIAAGAGYWYKGSLLDKFFPSDELGEDLVDESTCSKYETDDEIEAGAEREGDIQICNCIEDKTDRRN